MPVRVRANAAFKPIKTSMELGGKGVYATPYGLTNYMYVYTRNFARRCRMARLLRSGKVEMNDAGGDHGSPFGGVKGSG